MQDCKKNEQEPDKLISNIHNIKQKSKAHIRKKAVEENTMCSFAQKKYGKNNREVQDQLSAGAWWRGAGTGPWGAASPRTPLDRALTLSHSEASHTDTADK